MEVIFPSTMVGDLKKMSGREIAEVAEQADGGGSADGGFATILGGCWIATLDRGPYPAHVFEPEERKPNRKERRAGAREPEKLTYTGPDWRRVLKGDLVAGMLHLTRVSITDGDDYGFDVPCRSCGKSIPWELQLSDLPVRVLPEKSIEKIRAGEPFEASVAGKKVLFDLQTVASEEPVLALMRREGRKVVTIVEILAAQVRSVEGVSNDLRARWNWLNDLSLGELQDLQHAVEDVDCGVETNIEIRCSCNYVQEVDLPLGRRLFEPRRRRR